MVRSFACACPPPSGSLCSQRRTLSAGPPLSDLGSLLEIGPGNLSTNSGPKKPVGFFTVSGRQPLGVENHRSKHSRFVGIPKGPPFGDSLPHLSGQSERWAPGGPGPSGSLCSQRRTLSAVLPMSDGRSLLEIGPRNLSTTSGPKKPVGFLRSRVGAPWCRKPQKNAPQICGDSKGPSLWRIFLHTFCASRKYGRRRHVPATQQKVWPSETRPRWAAGNMPPSGAYLEKFQLTLALVVKIPLPQGRPLQHPRLNHLQPPGKLRAGVLKHAVPEGN